MLMAPLLDRLSTAHHRILDYNVLISVFSNSLKFYSVV